MAERSTLIPPPYRSLEAVRGLASVWVVCYHALLLMAQEHPWVRSVPGAGILHNGYLGVQVFFVVSGYCIASAACSALGKPHPVRSFAWARMRRIFPPCWASLALVGLAALLASWLVSRWGLQATSLVQLDLAHRPLAFYLTNLTLTQLAWALPHRAAEGSFMSLVCWTLCYEIAFYFIVGLVLSAVRIKSADDNRPSTIRLMLNILHAITLVCGVILILRPAALIYPFDLWVQFGLGAAVFDVVRNKQSWRAWGAFMTGGFLTTVFLLCRSLPIGQTQQPSVDTFATALGAAIILLVCHGWDGRLIRLYPIRVAAFVGTFSYSLYLVNFLLVSGIMMVYKRLPLPQGLHFAAIFGIVLLVLPCAYLFFLVFEKPFLRSRPATDKRESGIRPAAPRPHISGAAPVSAARSQA